MSSAAASVPAAPDAVATMRAITQPVYGPPEALRAADLPRPVPAAGEVLVRVAAAGIDPSIWHLLAGDPRIVRLAAGLRRPRRLVPGLDVAGTVVAVGEGVTSSQPGDEVFGVGRGVLAEFTVARADRCLHRPETVTVEQAAALPVSATTALQAVRRSGRVQAGHDVLVLGAGGGVGTFAVQVAVADGARVTAVCSDGKADLVRSLGASEVIDYHRTDPLSGDRRYDVIIDIAGLRPLPHLRRALTPTGTLVIVGGEGGGAWLGGLGRNLRASLTTPLVRQQLRWIVATTGPEDLQELAAAVADGTLSPVLDRTFPLDRSAEALRYVKDGHALGKVVVTVP
ncbi:NAD(P)-dependent alcohol dehydrogenase [Egicoccus sp. AB-alg6-2]|uniref:NAD(P)-dependent alcohol dehydrogenase n=1 Tax=Egicoccus sp. AB-alg6-2 TaxID=3242692 RepID=UPI00359EE745